MQVSILLCLFSYIGLVISDVEVIWPGAKDTLNGNSWVNAIVTESKNAPLFSDLDNISMALCTGSNEDPVYLWTVYNITSNANTTTFPTYFEFFIFPFIAEDGTNVFFFCINSTFRSNSSIQVINSSERFTLDNMNGTFSSDLTTTNAQFAGDAAPDRIFTCNHTICDSTAAFAGTALSASTQATNSSSHSLRTAQITGGTLGGAVFVGLIISLAVFLCRRHQRPKIIVTEEEATPIPSKPAKKRFSDMFFPSKKSKVQWWDELPPPDPNCMELPADTGSYSLAEMSGTVRRPARDIKVTKKNVSSSTTLSTDEVGDSKRSTLIGNEIPNPTNPATVKHNYEDPTGANQLQIPAVGSSEDFVVSPIDPPGELSFDVAPEKNTTSANTDELFLDMPEKKVSPKEIAVLKVSLKQALTEMEGVPASPSVELAEMAATYQTWILTTEETEREAHLKSEREKQFLDGRESGTITEKAGSVSSRKSSFRDNSELFFSLGSNSTHKEDKLKDSAKMEEPGTGD